MSDIAYYCRVRYLNEKKFFDTCLNPNIPFISPDASIEVHKDGTMKLYGAIDLFGYFKMELYDRFLYCTYHGKKIKECRIIEYSSEPIEYNKARIELKNILEEYKEFRKELKSKIHKNKSYRIKRIKE